MPQTIEIKDLTKIYSGGFEALKGINLTIREGEFFGLLGPNGAGKSTTIGIMCSLVKKTSGSVSIFGKDIDTEPDLAKQFLGIVPQEFNFNIFEPVHQIILNQAGYYGVTRKAAMDRAEYLLNRLEIWDRRNTPGGRLSGGLKRRLMIARALVHSPKVLILDEPTAGVDISLRRSMWIFLQELNDQGRTIILTTHYLEEAESLCKNLAIIDKGVIIENAPTVRLLEKLSSEVFILYCHDMTDVSDLAYLRVVEEGVVEAELNKGETITRLIETLTARGIIVDRIKNKANRLEELFVKLVAA